ALPISDEAKAASIISQSPLTEFGATCIYPQIPGIPPYHNNGIWPFVQSYWNWAAAKTGNEAVLTHGLASVYRAAALFLTNYENMVAETGDFLGTEINSHRMLWSMAGNLAMVHRVFMGMEFRNDGLHFTPVVPKAFGGEKTLSNFTYRDAKVNITIKGYGNQIKSATINGEAVEEVYIPTNASGTFDVVVELVNQPFPHQNINLVENYFTPTTVLSRMEGDQLVWDSVAETKEYRIYKNGELLTTTSENSFKIEDEAYASYMVSAVDEMGYEGFASEPLLIVQDEQIIEVEDFAPASSLPYTNYSGRGFAAVSLTQNREINIPVTIEKAGIYSLDFKYANGSGRWNTNNKCAIRSLTVNGDYQGVIVLPQRGQDEWSDWGFSNITLVELQVGENVIKVHFEDWNNNMNVDVNTAMLDFLRLRAVR
ncbi:MAG: glycogen debranching protein, partial [Bacteroidota bacterium]